MSLKATSRGNKDENVLTDQAVRSLKALSKKVDEHTGQRMEAVYVEFEEGGYHVQGHE